MQKLGVVTEYLSSVDTAMESGGSDSPNLVRELTEEAEHRSDYRSCGSDTPHMSSSSTSSSSDDGDGWNGGGWGDDGGGWGDDFDADFD